MMLPSVNRRICLVFCIFVSITGTYKSTIKNNLCFDSVFYNTESFQCVRYERALLNLMFPFQSPDHVVILFVQPFLLWLWALSSLSSDMRLKINIPFHIKL